MEARCAQRPGASSRDFFYKSPYRSLDLQASEERYERFLPNIGSRGDLNYLFNEMLGELSVGHLFVRGGDVAESTPVKGLLGADYRSKTVRYRFERVYSGENWKPQTRSTHAAGVNVAAGEYLLAVAGRDCCASDEIYSSFFRRDRWEILGLEGWSRPRWVGRGKSP